MTTADYYRTLDLTPEASVAEIKKAYRQKARLYHPDISKNQNTQELFISATEAYDFLISYRNKIITDHEADSQVITDWQKQSQKKSRRKAYTYARGSYSTFKNSNLYKTTRFFNGTITICGFVLSIIIVIYTITGYFYRLKHPIPEMEKPSLFVFIMLLIVGIAFFLVSLASLTNHIKSSAKKKK
jgi:hypothetical protein